MWDTQMKLNIRDANETAQCDIPQSSKKNRWH